MPAFLEVAAKTDWLSLLSPLQSETRVPFFSFSPDGMLFKVSSVLQ